MKARWRITLPLCGLVLFGMVPHRSIAENRLLVHNDRRYFSWSGIRLDSDPLGKHSKGPAVRPCGDTEKDCFTEPMDVWVDPGWITMCLVILAFPAFLIGAATVDGTARLGGSEVVSFMVSMPLLIGAWFYFTGRFLDRRKSKRSG